MKRMSILWFLLFPITLFSVQAQTTPSGDSEAMMGFARTVDVPNGLMFIGEPANIHPLRIVYIYGRSDTDWMETVQPNFFLVARAEGLSTTIDRKG